MVVAVQQPGWQLAEVSVVLLVEERKRQVAPRSDVLQNKLQHVVFHHPIKLRHEPGEQLHSNLQCIVKLACHLQQDYKMDSLKTLAG